MQAVGVSKAYLWHFVACTVYGCISQLRGSVEFYNEATDLQVRQAVMDRCHGMPSPKCHWLP